MVKVESITKKFKTDFWKKEVTALSDVSLEVRQGSVFGLIGHNGAGKTTLIKILTGLMSPTQGRAYINGLSCETSETKKLLGYLPEAAYYYDYLRADELLQFYARLFGVGRKAANIRVDELLELVGLKHRRDIRLRYFSKGMLQRIGIAQALINDPDLVILDEPMSGLDPIGRKEVRDIILHLKEQKKTIIFSSHILSDVEALCDDVAILVRGKLHYSGALQGLVQPHTKSIEIILKVTSAETWPERFHFSSPPRQVGEDMILTLPSQAQVHEVVSYAIAQGHQLVSLSPHRETLENIYVEASEVKK